MSIIESGANSSRTGTSGVDLIGGCPLASARKPWAHAEARVHAKIIFSLSYGRYVRRERC